VAILRAGRPRIGLTGVQVQVDGGEVLGAEEVGPEVGVALGHDHRVVAEDLLQLLDGPRALGQGDRLERLGLGTELMHFAIKNGLVGS